MSNVIEIASRRQTAAAMCGCPAHTLGALVARLSEQLDSNEGALLADWPTQADVLRDAISTINAALDTKQRTKP